MWHIKRSHKSDSIDMIMVLFIPPSKDIILLKKIILPLVIYPQFYKTNVCSIQTKCIQNALNGNLQTFTLATVRLVFVKDLLIVNTVSSLMSFIK
jgi:hypothetical protein